MVITKFACPLRCLASAAFLRGLMTTLALCSVVLNPVAALAEIERVGELTIDYTLTAAGNGHGDWPSPPYAWPSTTSDNINVSLSGQKTYEVLKTETNFLLSGISAVIKSSQVSGSGSQSSQSGSSTWTYFESASSTYLNVRQLDNDTYAFVDWKVGINADRMLSGVDICGASLMVQTIRAAQFKFDLTPFVQNGGGVLSTNVSTNSVESAGVILTGDANAAVTLSLKYVPDELKVPFTASTTNGTAALGVQFEAAEKDNMNTAITSWHWDFGDGEEAYTQDPFHRYTTNGTFVVTLTATNANRAAVRGAGPSSIVVTRPTVEFKAWPTNGYLPLHVGFTSPLVDSGNNRIVSWAWDFGDLTSLNYQNPSHIYIDIKSKTFSPKLTITNELGMAIKATGPKIYTIYPPVLFTVSTNHGRIPLAVQFSAPAADGFDVPLTNWSWNFGDGTTGKGQNAAHAYTNIGVFRIILTAKNTNGTTVYGYGPEVSAGWWNIYTLCGGGYSNGSYTNMDGAHPQTGLTLAGNRLFGVMSSGGLGGSGTIFSVNTDGSGFTNLYDFSPVEMGWYTNGDGAMPRARLVVSGDTLYGVASAGGSRGMGDGTVFRIGTNGSGFTSLHGFASSDSAGVRPAGLALCGNTLYGTAQYGGSNYNGTLFKLQTDGSGFDVIHHFGQSDFDPVSSGFTNIDGAYPCSALLVTTNGSGANILYGTTSQGGPGGGGTLFRVNPDGSDFTVLHAFKGSGGSSPQSELLCLNDTLFGTTQSGGLNGNGTVFRIQKDGSAFASLHSFCAGTNDANWNIVNDHGANPVAGLCAFGEMLYGTTQSGGAGGSGAVFAIRSDGTGFTNLYSFTATAYDEELFARTNLDGANPYGGLVVAGDYVYGTACNGGSTGQGALFALNVAAAIPRMDIQLANDGLVVAWPSGESGWTLQQCGDLGSGNWSVCTLPVTDDGQTRTVRISTTTNLFLRLVK